VIKNRALETLVEFDGRGKVLSVYLDTDLGNKSKDTVKLRFKDCVRGMETSAAAEVGAVQKYLDFEFDWQPRGLGIWVSGDTLWEVVPLPIPTETQAFHTDRPYIRVLIDILDRFAEYGVALIDRENVRLFSVAFRGIRSESEAFGEELKRHKQGGWAAARYQRHEDNLALHNLKNAVEVTEAFCSSRGSKRLVLGGTPEVLAQVKGLLSKQVRDWLLGEFVVDIDASPNEILKRSLEIAERADLAEEKRMVSEAITAAAKGETGVTGLSDTLYSLHHGQVLVLLVEEGYRAPGYVCAHCGYVSAEAREACPLCKHEEMTETPDVVDVAIHKAIGTGAQVNIVRENEKLREAGGIAAILRY